MTWWAGSSKEGMALTASAIAGTGAAIAQTMMPEVPSVERLGVAGLLVLGAYFMLRYFMGVVERKDALIKEMMDSNTTRLVEHIEAGYEVQREIKDALNSLASAVRERGRH